MDSKLLIRRVFCWAFVVMTVVAYAQGFRRSGSMASSKSMNPHDVTAGKRQPEFRFCCASDKRDENGIGEVAYYYAYAIPGGNDRQRDGYKMTLLQRVERDARSRAGSDKRPKTEFKKIDSGFARGVLLPCYWPFGHAVVHFEFYEVKR